MKTITIELSTDSCNRALKELQDYQKKLKPKLDEICKRLAEIGAQEARLRLGFARGYGNTDARVDVVKMDNGYKIVMSGKDIYFIEFGTGIYAGEYAGDTSNVSVGTMPGDWSDSHAQMFSRRGYWFYDNVFYRGTPAEMPMYYAGQAIRSNEKRIAQEVLRN